MATTEALSKGDKTTAPAGDNEIATAHFKAAAKRYREAADQHEVGDHDEAALSTVIAQRHIALARQVGPSGEIYFDEYGDSPIFI